jgi:hypothetical protein
LSYEKVYQQYNNQLLTFKNIKVSMDWDRIVHKNVRSKDRADVGNVDAVDEGSSNNNRGARGECKIPKSEVEGVMVPRFS